MAATAILGAIAGGLFDVERPRPTFSDSLAPTDAAAPAPGVLQRFLEAFDEPLMLVERQTVTQINAAAAALLGAHVVGGDARLAIRHPALADRLIGRDDSPNQPVSAEVMGIGGADHYWQVTIHEIDRNMRLVHLVDRTSRHAAERMRVDFVANASHELRTPLATLIGFIETLQDANGPEDAAARERFLKIMSSEGRRMQRLIDDLISLSRIEGEKFAQPADAVPLAPLLSEVTAAIRDARVETRIEGRPVVRGDHVQLSQLLHNLIGNGVKYGRAGTPVTVTVAPGPEGMVTISVADQGEGIAPEHLPRLTERFYRVDAGRSRSVGGTGLGLAIVKHIVERHRGKLDIQSEVGVGTTVKVQLPAISEGLSS